MADAKVVFETELDTSGLEAGINSLERDGLTQLEFGVSEKTVSNMAHAFASSLATKLQVEFLKATGKTGMAFEAAMAQVAATLGTTVSQIPELERLAKASAEGGIFSAVESAEALSRSFPAASLSRLQRKLNGSQPSLRPFPEPIFPPCWRSTSNGG